MTRRPNAAIIGYSILWLLLLPAGGCPADQEKAEPQPAVRSQSEDVRSNRYLIGIWPPSAGQVYMIGRTEDDGTEVDGIWQIQGVESGHNRIGTDSEGKSYSAALVFDVPDLYEEQRVEYARLRLASKGSDMRHDLTLLISGIDEDNPRPFSQDRLPRDLVKTEATVTWQIRRGWDKGTPSLPLYYSSPDIAPILNEIIARPGWGSRAERIAVTVEQIGGQGRSGYLDFEDASMARAPYSPALLEVCPTVGDAFIAKPMLGRPTDSSVTINIMSLLPLDFRAVYGTRPDALDQSTGTLPSQRPGHSIEIVIENLSADTRYYYALMYRSADGGEWQTGFEGEFRTQRSRGAEYVLTLQADSHVLPGINRQDIRKLRLYERTLGNILEDSPDFLIDMGDFAHIEYYAGRTVRSLNDALERYLVQRQYLEGLSSSIPFYLVLGNHEGEQGWRIARPGDSLEVWGTLARKMAIPNPYPDAFYSGSTDHTKCCGLRQNYFAWEWGDALFVVLDPFWYTETMPHLGGGYLPSMDGWDWTLGRKQYEWLHKTLRESDARWKFVMTHHMTGGVLAAKFDNNPYGRGGIDAASYSVAQRPSFEWGGEDSSGTYVFNQERRGWEHGPIHQVMVAQGVDIFFHGHDHIFVHEDLDGIVYQACPSPCEPDYGDGFFEPEYYSSGAMINNSGHLRVMVSPDSVRVDYVRSVLPEDEPVVEEGRAIRNRTISYSYTLRK